MVHSEMTLWHARVNVHKFRTPKMLARRYVEEIGSAAMMAAKRSAHAAPEVNLREHVIRTPPPSANKDLRSRAYVTKSPKQGYQSPLKKDSIFSIFSRTCLRLVDLLRFRL